jgi:hypothetical protein
MSPHWEIDVPCHICPDPDNLKIPKVVPIPRWNACKMFRYDSFPSIDISLNSGTAVQDIFRLGDFLKNSKSVQTT